MRLTAQDLREMNILKYYRLTRKWVCKTYGLKDADFILTTGADAVDFYGTIAHGAANSTARDVDGDASKLTIDGSASQDLEGMRMTVLCDGANWHLTGYNTVAIATASVVLSASA